MRLSPVLIVYAFVIAYSIYHRKHMWSIIFNRDAMITYLGALLFLLY